MADRASADRACKDPNPIIDGRKANVNLAYLGAKPRVIQPGETLEHSLFSHHRSSVWQTKTAAIVPLHLSCSDRVDLIKLLCRIGLNRLYLEK